MAQTITISQKELQRVAALAYEGETLKVMLCSVGATGYTAQSTVANWQSVEKSGNGYSRFTATIATGSYNGTAAAYVMPDIDAAFTATSTGYSYDTVVIYINGETYLHSIIVESPNVTLVAGQTQTYRISLRQDD
jgi:hypothetical protein